MTSASLVDGSGVQVSHLGADVETHLRGLVLDERPRQELRAVVGDGAAARLATHRDDDSILEREVTTVTT